MSPRRPDLLEQRPQPAGLRPTTMTPTAAACSIQANASSSISSALAARRRDAQRASGPRASGIIWRSASPEAPASCDQGCRVTPGERDVHVLAGSEKFARPRNTRRRPPFAWRRLAQHQGDGDVRSRLETEWTTTPAWSGRDRAVGDEVNGVGLGELRPRGRVAATGRRRSSVESIRTRSVVGPSTRPSAVVATAVGLADAATSRRASPNGRSHRDSPPRVRASIDHEESITMRSRPRETAAVPRARDGRVTASASASAISDRQHERDRPADPLPERQLARLVEHAAPEQQGRHEHPRRPQLEQEEPGGSPATAAASSSHPCHGAMAANVMRRTVPAGTP